MQDVASIQPPVCRGPNPLLASSSWHASRSFHSEVAEPAQEAKTIRTRLPETWNPQMLACFSKLLDWAFHGDMVLPPLFTLSSFHGPLVFCHARLFNSSGPALLGLRTSHVFACQGYGESQTPSSASRPVAMLPFPKSSNYVPRSARSPLSVAPRITCRT